MNRFVKVFLAGCGLFAATAFGAAKFPFPQNMTYPNGIKPVGATHRDVQAAYDIFYKNYYEESGDKARIKWDTPTQSVSEGIAYGMLIMVYMDNAKNNTQAKFDKLWAYYNAFLNGNGVMHWKINGFSGVAEQNGATDAELDAAFALALAYYQWGDAKYKTAATSLMGKIYQHELAADKVLKPGDMFDYPKNPSYFVPAGIGFFDQIKFDNNDWKGVLTANYAFVTKCMNPTYGLVPDWATNDGQGDARGVNYTFDAARTPWRIALGYLWYGHAEAKTIAGKMTSGIKTIAQNDPANIKSGYKTNGALLGEYNLPTYIGPFTAGGMVDAAHQDWVNAGYKRLSSFIDDDNYYNESLQLLTMLTMTGNFFNMATMAPRTSFNIVTSVSPAGAGTVTLSPASATYAAGSKVTLTVTPSGENKFVSWGGDATGTTATLEVTVSSDMNITAYFNAGENDLVDDCEDGNEATRMGTKWFTYDDLKNKGKSTVTPITTATALFKMSDGGAAGSLKSAKIDYKLDKGTNEYNPFVGFGFPLSPVTDSTPVDISKASGLTFYYKGTACDVRVETLNIKDFGYFFKRLPAAADWTLTSLKWADFAQATWAVKSTMDLTKATKVAWQTTDKGVTGDAGIIAVDDVHLPGYTIATVSLMSGKDAHRLNARQNLRPGLFILPAAPHDALGRKQMPKALPLPAGK
jgi:endoglucanase